MASAGREQARELRASDVHVLGPCDAGAYPLQKTAHSAEFLRQIAHLRSRTRLFAAITRVRALLAHGLHAFFRDAHFVHVHTPILTGNDCEGAGEVFEVAGGERYFGGARAFLTVSGQLHAECLAAGIARVYTFGPTFRAEASYTRRHLSEFWMVEAEMAFPQAGLCGIIDVLEAAVCRAARHVLRHGEPDLAVIDNEALDRTRALAAGAFMRLCYADAVSRLQAAQGAAHADSAVTVPPPAWGDALGTEHERHLCAMHGDRPLFVHDYPAAVKPFYVRRNDGCSDGATAAAVDFLVPDIGEIAGGTMREERLEQLQAAMVRRSLRGRS